MSCIVYKNAGPYQGSIEISGTTCTGTVGMFYLNFGETICMDTSKPMFTCDYFKIEGPCPTPTATVSPTPTQTPGLCQEYTASKNSTFLLMSTISWTDCYGNPQSQDLYNPAGIGELETITFCAIPGTLSYNGTEITVVNNGVCIPVTQTPTPSITPTNTNTPTFTQTPTSTIPLTPSQTSSNTPTPSITPTNTATPTLTPTQTLTPTCGTFTTQYMEVILQSCRDFKLSLWENSNLTNAANAVCDVVVSGCAYGDQGTVYCGTETITSGQHQHNFNLNPVLQPGECVSAFTVNTITEQCPCYDVIYVPVTPTPTQTPSHTPTHTPTPSITASITPTNTATPTVTPTISVTPSQSPTSVTPTPTPTVSTTPNSVCPEELYVSGSTSVVVDNGTYSRKYFALGQPMQYAFQSGSTIVTGIAPDGYGYPVYEYYDGGDYNTYIMTWAFGAFAVWSVFEQNPSILTSGTLIGGYSNPSPATYIQIGSERFPNAGQLSALGPISGSWYVYYPPICPTSTPTPSVTQTNTPTASVTNTPTNTPSITQTNTPSNTETCTPTASPTPTNTPSASIICYTWNNNSGTSAYYDYTDCNGNVESNKEILNGGSICAQDGTVNYISGGVLSGGVNQCN